MTIQLLLCALAGAAVPLPAPGGEPTAINTRREVVHSEPGTNAWNTGRAPEDWRSEIERYHGHVGPWNVLGWRIGRAALRELNSEWGRHELDVVCYVPLQTPFTCLADGLSVGTGNSQGRLDLRLAEVLVCRQSFVSVRRKDGKGDVLEFRPDADYLQSILGQPVERLESLCNTTSEMPEARLFSIRRIRSE
jgi:formylmethanofuran dehydrogenase subunit E